MVIGALSYVGSGWQNLDSRGGDKAGKGSFRNNHTVLSILWVISLPNQITVWRSFLQIFGGDRYPVEAFEPNAGTVYE